MDLEYIIVQAGGKGSRMDYLTENKPKCLVPIDNLPMIFHLFKKYPNKKFLIIGDYKYDVLRNYLHVFAKVQYLLLDARGYSGTCAGIKQAMNLIPIQKKFMIIWSDLILPNEFSLPKENGNYVGLSGDFRCRWSYCNEIFEEEPSVKYGVAGFFICKDKSILKDIPLEGEFVKWLKHCDIKWDTIELSKTKEYGLIEEYNKLETKRCRPFNRIIENDGRIIKEGIDEQGRKLAVREKNWYRHVEEKGIKGIPKIYSFDPFVMEKISGKNIYEYQLTNDEKTNILKKIVITLRELHDKEKISGDYFSVHEAYYQKTQERLSKIRDLIPFADQREIIINGKKCRNIYFYMNELERQISKLTVEQFTLIHGDCTFSNMMLKNDETPVFIDPRGYFGHMEIYGDPDYDWAKLYYSLVGNYDQFNRKEFRLHIKNEEVELFIKSNEWEDMESLYFELLGKEVLKNKIQLLHAIIWLSLTTYAWEDFDSICGAFYMGIYYLEDIL
ncbi:MAG: phosphotransferase [Lachnospiraceae bacterium]|nr:phosphotransferase [Lachnospiraceae bacterium]